jgi:hypothetical protein
LKSILTFLVLLLGASLSYSQTYELKNDVIDDGGTKMTSVSYICRGSLGQSTIGKISSSSYLAWIGFWHPYPGEPGVGEKAAYRRNVPIVFALSQNYPNPVIRSTLIRYGVPIEGTVRMRVFNSAGQEIKTLIQVDQRPGYYEVNWNIRRTPAELLPNGVYFYRLEAGRFARTRKMIVLR